MAGISGYSEDNDEGQAAHEAIRHLFPELCSAVLREDISDVLYAQEILDKKTFEIATNKFLTSQEKGREVVQAVQNVVHINVEAFEKFCMTLSRDEMLKDTVQKLRGKNHSTVYNYILNK